LNLKLPAAEKESIDVFIEPEAYPQALDLLFEEYLSRKLIGDFT
jgi:hypothetical protein